MSISKHMNAAEALVTIYITVKEYLNDHEAKNYASAAIYSIICELQEEKLPVTPEEIERRLVQQALELKSTSEAEKKKSIA